jgi:hypothetical protein
MLSRRNDANSSTVEMDNDEKRMDEKSCFYIRLQHAHCTTYRYSADHKRRNDPCVRSLEDAVETTSQFMLYLGG